MHKVLEFVSTVHDLCAVLGMDFFSTVTEVHPSLNDSTSVQSKSISNDTLSRLAKTVLALKEDKKQRLHKVTSLVFDFWFPTFFNLGLKYYCLVMCHMRYWIENCVNFAALSLSLVCVCVYVFINIL